MTEEMGRSFADEQRPGCPMVVEYVFAVDETSK